MPRVQLLHAGAVIAVFDAGAGGEVRVRAAELLPDLEPSTLKLVCSGRVVRDEDSLASFVKQAAAAATPGESPDPGLNVLVTGSLRSELAALRAVEASAAAITARVRDDRLVSGTTTLEVARTTHAAFVQHARRMVTARGDERFGFGQVQPLPGFADAAKAVEYLESIAMDAGVLAVMRARRWFVPVLSEMPADGKVGVDPVCVLGLNVNKGAEIKLRLRTDDGLGFRKREVVMKTVMHELAHNELSEHTGAFYDLVSELTRQAAAGDWRAGSGHVLGGPSAAAGIAGSGAGAAAIAPHTRSTGGGADAGPAFIGGVGYAGGGTVGDGYEPVGADDAAAAIAAAARKRLEAAAAASAPSGGGGAPGPAAAAPSAAAAASPPSALEAHAAAVGATLVTTDDRMSDEVAMDGSTATASVDVAAADVAAAPVPAVAAHPAGAAALEAHAAAVGAAIVVGNDSMHDEVPMDGSAAVAAAAVSNGTGAAAQPEAGRTAGAAAAVADHGEAEPSSGGVAALPAAAHAAAATGHAEVDADLPGVDLADALSAAVAEMLVAGVPVRDGLSTLSGMAQRAADALTSLATELASTGAGPSTGAAAGAGAGASADDPGPHARFLRVRCSNATFLARTGGGAAVQQLLRAAGFTEADGDALAVRWRGVSSHTAALLHARLQAAREALDAAIASL